MVRSQTLDACLRLTAVVLRNPEIRLYFLDHGLVLILDKIFVRDARKHDQRLILFYIFRLLVDLSKHRDRSFRQCYDE